MDLGFPPPWWRLFLVYFLDAQSELDWEESSWKCSIFLLNRFSRSVLFALVAELSSRNSCLAAMAAPELSWSGLCPTIAEKDSDKRGKAGEGFGNT
jgi:hypothetical protein